MIGNNAASRTCKVNQHKSLRVPQHIVLSNPNGRETKAAETTTNIVVIMTSRTLQTCLRNASRTALAFPVVQKRFAATVLQKPRIVDLSRELYHRCLNHPFHVPFVCPPSERTRQSIQLTYNDTTDPNTMGHPPAQSRRQRHPTLRLLRVNNVRPCGYTRRCLQALRIRWHSHRRNATRGLLHIRHRSRSLARGAKSFNISARNGRSAGKVWRGDQAR
jgi:hypothetical protein